MRHLLKLLIISLFLFSCSKKGGETTATFKLSLSGTSALTGAGGAMVWGRSDNGKSFAYNLGASGESILLPNETWNFVAVTWSGTSGIPMTGTVKCAFSPGNSLTGGDTEVDLVFSNGNCGDSNFSPVHHTTAGEISFPEIEFSSCRDFGAAPFPNPCEFTTTRSRGFVKSYRIVLPEYIASLDNGSINVGGNHLVSECFSTDVGAAHESHLSTATAPINIPLGNFNFPLKTEIVGFYNENCDPGRGSSIKEFPNGLALQGHSSGSVVEKSFKAFTLYNGPISVYRLFHEVNPITACSTSAASISEMRLGMGTTYEPYGICNVEDFNKVGNDPALLASSFELLQDLDFGGYSTILNEVLGRPQCGHLGTSLIPFGGLKSDYPACTANITSPTQFSGTFYGSGKKLKNVFLIEEDLSYMGVFRKVGPGGNIQNLTIENAEIEGKDKVGTLAGTIDDATLQNIFIIDTYVDADSNAGDSSLGGAVGYDLKTSAAASSIDNVHVLRAEIDGDGNYIGGIIGYSQGPIYKSSFVGSIKGDGPMAIEYVGGIAGKHLNGSISEVKSVGAITGRFKNVGGIVGYLASSTSITDSYSHMSVFSAESANNVRMGGIVGHGDTSSSLTRVIFSGAINHSCATAATPCEIGNIVGYDNTVSKTQVYNVDTAGGATLGGSEGTQWTIDQIERNTGTIVGSVFTTWASPLWSYNTPGLPRLAWENSIMDACVDSNNNADIATQRANGRGTDTNPVIICNAYQFLELGLSDNNTKAYEVKNLINLHQFTDSNILTNFTGKLFGKGAPIVQAQAAGSATNDRALFGAMQAGSEVRGLNFIGLDFRYTSTSDVISTIAGTNHGVIKDVNLIASGAEGNASVGGVVAVNHGTIENVTVNYSKSIKTATNTGGGVAGSNDGTIEKVKFNGHVEVVGSATSIGGVVGVNNGGGVVREVASNVYINSPSSSASLIGGIVGDNAALIEDAIFSEHGSMTFTMAGVTQVGGIAGNNTGTINRSLSLGVIGMADATVPNTVGGTVGNHAGSLSGGNFYFMKPYSTSNEKQSDTVSSVTSTATCDVTPTGAPSFAAGDFVKFPTRSNEVYEIVGNSAGTLNIDASRIKCGNLTGSDPLEVIAPTGANTTDGTQLSTTQLLDINTYCTSGVAAGDPNFRCSTGWDIIEDSQNGAGLTFLLDMFRADVFDQPLPTNSPKWIIENGDSPDLFIEW